jgi:hypothetical protein
VFGALHATPALLMGGAVPGAPVRCGASVPDAGLSGLRAVFFTAPRDDAARRTRRRARPNLPSPPLAHPAHTQKQNAHDRT